MFESIMLLQCPSDTIGLVLLRPTSSRYSNIRVRYSREEWAYDWRYTPEATLSHVRGRLAPCIRLRHITAKAAARHYLGFPDDNIRQLENRPGYRHLTNERLVGVAGHGREGAGGRRLTLWDPGKRFHAT
jgi:hypothetical protein